MPPLMMASAIQGLSYSWLLTGWLDFLFNSVGSLAAILMTFVCTLAIPATLGMVILGPINHVAGRLRARTRFFLSDFLWLVVQYQLALAYCSQFVGYRTYMFSIVTGFLLLAITSLWAGAVSFLSRAAVTAPYRRAVFILLLLPAALTAMMISTLLVLVVIVSWSEAFDFTVEYRAMFQFLCDSMGLSPLRATVIAVSMPVVAFVLRYLALWIIRDSEAGNAQVAPVVAVAAAAPAQPEA